MARLTKSYSVADKRMCILTRGFSRSRLVVFRKECNSALHHLGVSDSWSQVDPNSFGVVASEFAFIDDFLNGNDKSVRLARTRGLYYPK